MTKRIGFNLTDNAFVYIESAAEYAEQGSPRPGFMLCCTSLLESNCCSSLG